MNKVGIIGAGNLGARHLQAFSLANRAFELFVVDLSLESLQKARNIFENSENTARHMVHYINNIEGLPKSLDVVIVATNSNIRRSVIEELLTITNVNYLLLEKVLFQKLEDYDSIGKVLKEKNIKTWVNCPRRTFDFYKNLKAELEEATSMEINVSGSLWGLACNGIHMLDLIAFLAGSKDTKVDVSNLEENYIESKRKGFLEINGTLKGSMGRCSSYAITCYPMSDSPVTISINSDILKCIIVESSNTSYISRKKSNWMWENEHFIILQQSQRTQLVVQDILDKGDCDLVEYEESAYLHKCFQEPLITYFGERGIRDGLCPIT